ncbi:MAG: hypothetical protein ACYSTL_05935, partial [Planctomycetota bacterium]
MSQPLPKLLGKMWRERREHEHKALGLVSADTPDLESGVDELHHRKIIESNGEILVLEIDVVEATGKRWFKKKYSAEASESI